MRTRLMVTSCVVTVVTVGLLEACVSDVPADATGGDASSGSDSTTSDGSQNTDGSSTDSSSSDAGLSFDGANAYCNDLFPQSAPQEATVECPDASIGFVPAGGSIALGRYYLYDQIENSPGCGAAGSRPGFDDAVQITGDGGTYVVNAALDGANARRLTLTFSNFTSTTFTLTQTCPADGGAATGVPYTFSNDGTYSTLRYQLAPGGNLGIYTFRTY